MTSTSPNAERFADAAANLIGTRFRLFGRHPETGLDCVGLVLESLKTIGLSAEGPRLYGLRNSSIEQWFHHAILAGFSRTTGPSRRGDLILSQPGPAQHHLAILDTLGMIIHAHAGIRRVVRQPLQGALAATIRWRLNDPT